jgi:hypothetical protein
MAFELNKRIAIKDGFSGVVRYVGPVEGKTGEWVGIELDSALGANDGSYMGKQYFFCAPRCGVFIRTSRLTAEGAADDTENYAIRERKPATGAPSRANRLDQYGMLYTYHVPREEPGGPVGPARHSLDLHSPRRPTGHAFDPDQSLFSEETALSPRAQPYDGAARDDAQTYPAAVSASATSLEAENRYLRGQLFRYKELFCTVLGTYKAAIERVRSELQVIQTRLSRIRRPLVQPGEKGVVAAIVSELYSEHKKGNRKRANALYDRFKDIVSKYNIRVD